MNPLDSSWRLSPLAHAVAVPWRNGGGITHELAAWPGVSHWQWRISVAQVDKDGPFSRFDATDRHFAVLSGDGVRLTFAQRMVELTAHDAPFAFSGDDACDCELLSGPTLDFNLMCRGMSARLQRFERSDFHFKARAGDTVGCYAIEPAHLEADGQRLDIPAHTLCWCEAQQALDGRVSGNSFLGWALSPGPASRGQP